MHRVKGHGIIYPNVVIKKFIRTAVLENDAKFTKSARVGISFLIKLQDGDLKLHSKRDSTTDLFLKIMRNF